MQWQEIVPNAGICAQLAPKNLISGQRAGSWEISPFISDYVNHVAAVEEPCSPANH
jgi:hypothetical protein